MATLKDITTYIPTINRPQYLDRCLNFLSSYKEELNILVFDSSDSLNKKLNIDICDKYSDLSISYISEMDIDKQFHNMGQIFYYVLQNHIQTKYVTFCGDDDFIFVHNFIPHMNFLEENPDYIVCHGNIILFKESHGNLTYLNTACSMDLFQEDPIDRFLWYCLNASSIQYGVIKTADMLKAHRFCDEIDHRWLSPEVLPTILTVLYGKVKNLGTLCALQEWGHPLISIKSDGEKQIFNNWLFKLMNTESGWSESFMKMVKIFADEVKRITNKEESYIYSLIEEGFSFRIVYTYDPFLEDFYIKNKDSINKYTTHHSLLSDIGKTKFLTSDWEVVKGVLECV